MTYKILYTGFLFLGLVITTSCSTIKLPHGTYKNIGKRYGYEFVDSDNCEVNIYYQRFLFSKHKKLNGKYCIDNDTNFKCAEFSDGVLNGDYFVYDKERNTRKNELIEKGSYKNGLRDGIKFEYFENYSNEKEKKVPYIIKKNYQSGYVNGFLELYEDNQLIRKTDYKNSVKDGYSQ